MNAPTCNAPIPFDTLVEYWFGELAANEEEHIEVHLLGCGPCSERLADMVDLGAGIRAVFRNGEVWAVISPAFLQKMKQQGLRLREYPVVPGGSVNCTISAADDAVVGRLQVSLKGVTRVDLVRSSVYGEGRLQDIPFEPATGEVLFCPPAAGLRKSPAYTEIISLVAVDAAGERPIADYTFMHTPS